MQLSCQKKRKAVILRPVFKIFIHLEFRPFPQASITNFTLSHGTQTFWVFLTVCTHASPQHQNPDCIHTPLSPAAAVYLIHDPAIIRQSPVGPFLARGDKGRATKYIIFRGNICKWRRGRRTFPHIWQRIVTCGKESKSSPDRPLYLSSIIKSLKKKKKVSPVSTRKVHFCHFTCTPILVTIYEKFASWESSIVNKRGLCECAAAGSFRGGTETWDLPQAYFRAHE